MIKNLSVFLLLIFTVFFFNIEAALAHTPHDVIDEVEVSPNYGQDRTLFTLVRGNLLKSTNGGQNWKRIVKGLDNKHKLNSLEISPKSKKTLYLSSLGDGIYKSQDEGNSWFKVNKGLGTLDINLMAVYSDEVVLATGSKNGLYKSKNGGESWEQVIDRKITAIASPSEQKNYIVAGDDLGVLYVSNNGGEIWQQQYIFLDRRVINAIAFSPNFSADKTFFVGLDGGGIFKTVDGGRSFSEVNNGISDKRIMSIAISPNYAKDSTLLASSWYKGVFYSDNGGNTWTRSREGLTVDPQANLFKEPHFSDLHFSSNYNNDKTIFLAGFDGLFQSTDGGRVWSQIDTLSSKIIVGLGLSPDYANDSTLAFTTYVGGVYLSRDRGTTWKSINNGLEEASHYNSRPDYVARTFDLVFSPSYRADDTIFSASWHEFLRSTSEGKHWNKVSLPLTQNYPLKLVIAVSPNFASDRTVYLGTDIGEIFRSTNGGKDFSLVGNLGHSIHSLAISPDFASDRTLYAGVSGGVYKTVDGGETWQTASNGLVILKRKVDLDQTWKDPIYLTISPGYKVDETIFAGTAQGLFVTKDRGKSWVKFSQTAYGEDSYIEAIALSPNYSSDETFIVSVRGKGLFKTVDRGRNFAQIGQALLDKNELLSNLEYFNSTSLPIKFSPSYAIDKTIYGFSATELFKSTDGGETWENLQLPSSPDKNWITYLYFSLILLPKRIYLAAFTAAIFSYFLVGYLGIEKKLPYRRWQIRIGTALAAFCLVLIVTTVPTFLVNY